MHLHEVLKIEISCTVMHIHPPTFELCSYRSYKQILKFPNRDKEEVVHGCNGDSRYSASAAVTVVCCIHLLGTR